MATRQARALRGLVAALLAAFVAMLAHAVGGGSMPNLAGAAAAFALCAPACILLAGRTLSTVRLALAVALSQGAFHVLFWFTGSSSAGIVPRASAAMHDAMTAGAATGSTSSGSGSSMPGMVGMVTDASSGVTAFDGGMWAAHLAAAVVTVVALRRGEGAFWAAMGAARLGLVRLVRILVLVPQSIRRIAVALLMPSDARRTRFRSPGLRHRGPPAFAIPSA